MAALAPPVTAFVALTPDEQDPDNRKSSVAAVAVEAQAPVEAKTAAAPELQQLESDHVFVKNYEPEFKGKRSLKDMFLLRKQMKDGQFSFHVHFLPEGLRFLGLLGFNLMLVGGAILYKATYSSLTPVEDTYIYRTFGYAHACTLIDEGAPKAWGTMTLPLWEYPMVLYLLTSTQRVYDDWKEGKRGVTKGVMLYSLIVLPFNLLSTIFVRQIYVYGPGENGETFPAHYGFFIWFQLALVLDVIRNVWYQSCLKHLPFNNNRFHALNYVFWLSLITFINIIFGVSAAAGNPVFNWTHDATLDKFGHVISVLYFVLALPFPTFLAWYGVVYGDNRYVTFAMS
jgi:hypothetical protein